MKSDSNVAMTGVAGESNNNTGSSSKKKEFMKKMDDATDQMRLSHERTYKQRQEFIELQKAENNRNAERDSWNEYTQLNKEFRSLKRENDPDNATMLQNMAKRIRTVEKLLGIEDKDTITGGY